MTVLNPPLKHGQYIRVATCELDEVLPYVVHKDVVVSLLKRKVKKKSHEYVEATQRLYGDHMVKMSSQRYQLFKTKGVKCVECGIEGEFFGLETMVHQAGGRCHFNLYGRRDGKEVLITKDHIIPKSKGGTNSLSNYQVMCFECNIAKGDKL